MGGACGTYGGEERCVQGFGDVKDHLEGLDIDVRIILKWMMQKTTWKA
jgi:hypothetical protein